MPVFLTLVERHQGIAREQTTFLSADNVTGMFKNVLLKNIFGHLSIINYWSGTILKFRNSKVKTRPILYWSKMKLIKFEYTPLKVGLW